ncbi:MAG: type VI secretion system tip protein VgrG [Saprospiraceae bacterium]|nr:type VI secretion system tip protein VgrG [Saprospiraceae bacterium]
MAQQTQTSVPNDSRRDVVSFEVLVNGNTINAAFQVLNIVVTSEVNMIPTARLILRDGTPSSQTFEVSESDTFEPGNLIEIKLGRDSHNKSVFKGKIIRQSLKAKESGDSMLIVDCRDEAFELTLGRKNRYFENVKDSDAIQQVLGSKAGTIESTHEQHRELVQYYCSDWDFVVSRAEMNGKLVFVDKGKVSCKKPSTSETEVIELVFGSNLREFETELDARTQYGNVRTSAWDYTTQQLVSSESSSSGSFTEHGNLRGSSLASKAGLVTLELRHSGQVTEPELKDWADATLLRSRLAKIRGRAKIQGFEGVVAGSCVKLVGMGARFNGKAFVSAVRHELGAGAWYTQVQFGLSSEFFYKKFTITEVPAAGLTPSVSGLQIGIVVQLEGDPEGQDRIQVKLPTLDNAAKGTWARVTTLDAGNNRGSYFRPEIGDEVLVGFINDDPRDAIVLGMFNSSQKPAPISTKDTNHIKGFVTRSDMRILFDDENKVITISTPAGNKLIISEKDKAITTTDQSGNSWKMSADGIEIKSASDIKIEATGKIDIKAGADLKMDAINIKAKASANAELEGGAKAALKGSAQAEIKGGMVMIN